MTGIDFRAEAEALREELVERRRDLHRHPELAFQEERTAGIVADELNALGLDVQTGIGKTGVVGLLEGETDGPTVLVRADMDALPIDEANEAAYASTATGKMHACGHDGHTSIALAVARVMSTYRGCIGGRVKFVFQPAEEIGSGAKAMIADGVLENPKPDVALGLHLWNYLSLGCIGVADGPIMAGTSNFRITLEGKGGHAATPQITVDPVVCGAHLILALQTIVSRNIDPLDSAVVTVGKVQAGSAANIIPMTAELNGTFRTFRLETREQVETRIRDITHSICAAMGCTADIKINHHTIPVVNDRTISERVRSAFRQVIDESAFNLNARTTAAEDVAFFMDDIPGMYFFVGSANTERGLDFAHHHPRFDFDEDALPLGVALLSAAIAEFVFTD